MHLLRRFLCALITLCISPSFAAELPPITDWKEITVPPETQRGDYMVWSIAANDSLMNWRVFLKNGQPHALLSREFKAQSDKPNFKPQVEIYSYVADTLRVEDGWLVAFNEGEGGALYWFSPDGEKNYKVSDHQIVDLFLHQNAIHAIEGMSQLSLSPGSILVRHSSLSPGSIITVTRPEIGSRWKARSALKLPAAPSAVATLSDRMLIVLDDSIVSVTSEYSLTTLVPKLPWDGGLYTYSCVLATNQTTLYLGMRQYVGELDLQTKQFRLLIPSDEFIHKLPQKDADRIKNVYDPGELKPGN